MQEKSLGRILLLHLIGNFPSLILSIIIIILLLNPPSASVVQQDFFAGLKESFARHNEFKGFENQIPRITVLDQIFLDQAKAGNLAFFDKAKPGDYFLEFAGGLSIIYDPKDDKVINSLRLEPAPADLLDKLTAHANLASYKGVTPQIIKINSENVDQLRQQIAALTSQHIGQYILNYPDRLVVYDYDKDTISLNVEKPQAQNTAIPADFFQKLLAHPEVKGNENTSPSGGLVDQALLNQLKGVSEDLYNNAAIGDYALSYPDKIIIYNYQQDKVKFVYDVQNP